MDQNPVPGAPPVNNPQVGTPVNPVVPTVQPPAAQVSPPTSAPTQAPTQAPQAQAAVPDVNTTQPQSPVNAVTSDEKPSKFKLFLIVSIVLIVIIWGAVGYLYFQNQSL